MTTTATCPVCLLEIDDMRGGDVMRMPVCGHAVHTACALSAAQYDTRCPMCRTRDPSIVLRRESSTQATLLVQQIETLVAVEDDRWRRYRRQRSNVIRRHASLRKLRDRIRAELRDFRACERELTRAWCDAQRRMWNTDATLQVLKTNRRKKQRRVADLSRRLERRVGSSLGYSPPRLP